MPKVIRRSAVARAAYESTRQEIRDLFAEIDKGLEKHAEESKHDMNWTCVGDLEHYASKLRDIRDCLHGTGEYADE